MALLADGGFSEPLRIAPLGFRKLAHVMRYLMEIRPPSARERDPGGVEVIEEALRQYLYTQPASRYCADCGAYRWGPAHTDQGCFWSMHVFRHKFVPRRQVA